MKAKYFLFLLLSFAGISLAQDCSANLLFTTNGMQPTATGFDNRSLQCQTWTLAYNATGISGFTLAFQSSVGTNSPTSFGAYTGAMVASSSTFGTAALGVATYSSLSATPGSSVETPWVAVAVTGGAGSGNIRVTLQGWKTGATGGTGGGGGGGSGGCPNPCPVNGSVAVGSTAPNPVTTGTRNGAGQVAADYRFENQADITGSSVSAIKAVTGQSGKLTYVGHISVSLSAATTISIVQGLTSSTPCDTSASTLFGPYQNAVALALDFTRDDPLVTTTTTDDLCLIFGTSVTAGGGVVYDQR
jgi:hypothetical protein